MDFLNGIVVIDASSVLAGPSVGSFLAELGATVIKIENKKIGGDVTRNWHTQIEKKENISSYYASINYKKKIIQLNFDNDLNEFKNYIKEADILISNFKTEDYSKFEIENTQLHALNSKLIHARIKGFEYNENRVAYDVVLQAETGYMEMNGEPNGDPCKMPVALIDVLAAHQLKEGILLALIQRSKTNKGLFVEVSLEKSALCSLVNQASYFLMTGKSPTRLGSKHPNIAPYGDLYLSKDNKTFVLAIGSDAQFKKFKSLFNNEKLNDLRFEENTLRVENRDELNGILYDIFQKTSMSELEENFLKLNIPFGKVKTLEEVFQNSKAASLIYTENMEGTETKRIQSIAFELHQMC